MNEWIDVYTEKPKDELVLVKNEFDDIAVGSYEVEHDGGAWHIGNDAVSWDYDYNLEYEVTHWRKIPVE